MSVIQEDSSDAALRDLIDDEFAPERKKVVAREILKRRRHSERQAWLARHGWAAAIIGAFAGLAALVFRKRRDSAI
jgi:hypothetical protein